MLNVPKTNPVLQKFLQIHPGYNTVYRMVNTEQDARQDVEILNSQVDALVEARSLSIDQLEQVSKVLFGIDVSKVSTAELKRDVLVYAKQDPAGFLSLLNDPMLKLQAKVQSFFDAGYIVKMGRDVHFNTKSNKKRMLTIPFGEETNYIVSSYLKSDEGIINPDIEQDILKMVVLSRYDQSPPAIAWISPCPAMPMVHKPCRMGRSYPASLAICGETWIGL